MAEALIILQVTFAWTLLTVIFIGIGVAAKRLLGGFGGCCWLTPWLGWGVAIGFMQVWHCFAPVNGLARLFVATAGSAGLLWNWRNLGDQARGYGKSILLMGCLVGVAALWLAGQTTTQPGNNDSGLYHLNCVRWASSYPLIPGLVNLHGRLAFNQSFFLYVATLDGWGFAHKSHQLAAGLLLLWTLARGLVAGWYLIRSNGDVRAYMIFDVLTVFPMVDLIVNTGNASSPTPDVGVYVLGLLVFSEVIRLLSKSESYLSLGTSALIIIFLSVVGITVKLSFVPIAVAASLLVIMSVWKNSISIATRWRMIAITAGVCGAILIPWTIRGVVLSGYPVYPSTVGAIPVEWRSPEAMGRADADWVRAWSRLPGVLPEEVLRDWAWVWPWANTIFRKYQIMVVVPLVVGFVGILLGLWQRRRGWADTRNDGWGKAFCIPVTGFIFWFVTAPDPRFAGACFWMVGAGGLTWLLAGMPYLNRVVVIALYFALLLPQHINPIQCIRPWNKDAGVARTVPMEVRTTDPGLKVLVPAKGGNCWDSDLPATPYFNPALRLRIPGVIKSGFMIQKGN